MSGNYLNGPSARGGAFAFKLDALDKIVDIKFMNDNKKTMLMHIIETALQKEPSLNILRNSKDLELYEFATKTGLSQFDTDLNDIKTFGSENIVTTMRNVLNLEAQRVRIKILGFFPLNQ